MKTISIDRAKKINEQSDVIAVGMYAVIDDNSMLLAVRSTEQEAHAAAEEIETEFNRETDVMLVVSE